jgi:gluconolactonase
MYGMTKPVRATEFTRLPETFRKPSRTAWGDTNAVGQLLDSFLEGPSFDRAGNLYVTDIPFGRVFRISSQMEWTLVAEYDGWPNGSAFHRDGSLWITDYRRGLMRLRVSSSSGTSHGLSEPEPILAHRNSESFKGVNDLTFDDEGNCYFTDQGQTGLHDATGRVYRLRPTGILDLVMGGIPSPNGVALDTTQKVIFIAVTRANAVWRGSLLADGSATKVGAFRTFFGTSGPDGMAVDVNNGLVVAHASLGGAFYVNARGEITHFIKSPAGSTVTNVAYRPGTSTLVMTESESGSILEADLPAAGAALFSHK